MGVAPLGVSCSSLSEYWSSSYTRCSSVTEMSLILHPVGSLVSSMRSRGVNLPIALSVIDPRGYMTSSVLVVLKSLELSLS